MEPSESQFVGERPMSKTNHNFGKRLQRAAKAGAEDGVTNWVYGTAFVLAIAGLAWLLNALKDSAGV